MKLMNIDKEIPKYFYVFLDFKGDFGVVHKNNFKLTKKLTSGLINNMMNETYLENYINGKQKYLPFIPSSDIPISPTSFAFNIVNNYALEYNLEQHRYRNFGKYPSRLSAIYAFGDYETCKRVNQMYGWDLKTVKKFRLLENGMLQDLFRITKHNMEIVSCLRGFDCRFFSEEDQEKIYEHYWSGKGNLTLNNYGQNYNAGEIYEYLIDGILELVEE